MFIRHNWNCINILFAKDQENFPYHPYPSCQWILKTLCDIYLTPDLFTLSANLLVYSFIISLFDCYKRLLSHLPQSGAIFYCFQTSLLLDMFVTCMTDLCGVCCIPNKNGFASSSGHQNLSTPFPMHPVVLLKWIECSHAQLLVCIHVVYTAYFICLKLPSPPAW